MRHLKAIYREPKGKVLSDSEMETHHYFWVSKLAQFSRLLKQENLAESYLVLILQK